MSKQLLRSINTKRRAGALRGGRRLLEVGQAGKEEREERRKAKLRLL